MTWSPFFTLATPAPTSTTMPAPSWPRIAGNSPSESAPENVNSSVWQMPVALTSTSTSPAFGPSRSTSVTVSGLPLSKATAARLFMAFFSSALEHFQEKAGPESILDSIRGGNRFSVRKCDHAKKLERIQLPAKAECAPARSGKRIGAADRRAAGATRRLRFLLEPALDAAPRGEAGAVEGEADQRRARRVAVDQELLLLDDAGVLGEGDVGHVLVDFRHVAVLEPPGAHRRPEIMGGALGLRREA